MGIKKEDFQMEGKRCKDQERLKILSRSFMPDRESCFSMRNEILFKRVSVEEKRFAVATRYSLVAKRE